MWVTVSTGQRSSGPARLGTGPHVLGRAADCHVVVDDPHVSARHAQLDIAEGGAWLTDLRSTNGTFMDGARVQAPVWVPVPSEFRIGESTVRLTADEPTVLSPSPVPRTAPVSPSERADLRPPPPGAPAAPAPPGRIAGAGPVAGGDVAVSAGRDAAGRDLIIQEGFKLRTKMRSSAKTCIRLGAVSLLVGFGLFGYFVITWNNEIFDAVTDPAAEPPSDLPSPLPWLPLGAVLMFAGVVLVVTGLLIPRDRVVTRRDR